MTKEFLQSKTIEKMRLARRDILRTSFCRGRQCYLFFSFELLWAAILGTLKYRKYKFSDG